LEVVRTIRNERLIERSKGIAEQLHTGLEAIKARTGVIAEVRARGLMLAVELTDDAECSLTTATHRQLVKRGFIVARRPMASILRLDPALTVASQDIADFLTVFEGIVSGSEAD